MIPVHLIIILLCLMATPLGKIRLNPHGRFTTTPQLMPGWLCFVSFGQAMERQFRFVECSFE
jgi:hypothetical protein